ncbi:MATE family efflux transporter [Methylobacterium sp. Leaf456]|uniref:MATE family efflux transporter n=1 Tax=Methylobacterium sp. Leaf456 TaxID=1736382 RepID=UPI0006FC0A50|nr:MATE family efflux transporter [Methylobacterium sp. Leaf456]KQT56987.1 MATE family efflux transporter [Methylobacterium sp. Leaf456]
MTRSTGFAETALHPRPASPWRDEVRATLRLSAPLVLINLAQHGLVASNAILLGRLGAEPVAAGALATSLYLLLFIGGIGLTSAVAPLVAEAAGSGRAGDAGEVRRTVRAGLWLGALLGAVLMPLLWHTEALLAPLGQDPAVLRDAGAYMRVLQWWMLPALAFMVLKGALAALQRPGPPLAVSLAALPLNIALGAFFAFGPPGLGIVGVALGTVVTEFLALAALILVIGRDSVLQRYRMFARLWQFDGEKLGRLVRVGAPMGVAGVAEAGLFEAATIAMGTFGTVPLAAHAVTLQIAATCFMVPNGIGQAATVRVGRALGAGDSAGLRRAGAVAIGLGLAFMLACAALQLAVPRTLIGLFLDADAPGAAAVMPVAVGFLAFSALFAVSDGVQSVALGALRGLQDTTVPMVIALTGYWGIGVPLGAALAWGAGWGGQGIWAGFCAGLLAVSILLVTRWLRLSARV